jgi:hypothetical protein
MNTNHTSVRIVDEVFAVAVAAATSNRVGARRLERRTSAV